MIEVIHPIVAIGNPVLKKKAEVILPNGVDVKALAEEMFATMYRAHGVGLAAPQIGKGIRMFVIDPGPMFDEAEAKDKAYKKAFINPSIIEESGEPWEYEEGCLSIPDLRGMVTRKPVIKIKYQDLDYAWHEEVIDGMTARVIQHEYDHLEGILFVDHFSPIRKRLIKGKLAKIARGEVDVDYKMRF